MRLPISSVIRHLCRRSNRVANVVNVLFARPRRPEWQLMIAVSADRKCGLCPSSRGSSHKMCTSDKIRRGCRSVNTIESHNCLRIITITKEYLKRERQWWRAFILIPSKSVKHACVARARIKICIHLRVSAHWLATPLSNRFRNSRISVQPH